ncbi:hypothetical protein O9993_19825 [Vibrio lentus]|nr:hypothetical protein [Vibrio lentus]
MTNGSRARRVSDDLCKDRYGRVVENIALEEREEGKPLELTIDQRLQAIAYRAYGAVADHKATSRLCGYCSLM